jgi:hypothetical protein
VSGGQLPEEGLEVVKECGDDGRSDNVNENVNTIRNFLVCPSNFTLFGPVVAKNSTKIYFWPSYSSAFGPPVGEDWAIHCFVK